MYIVTGGAGFIGSVIVAQINAQKPDTPVVVVDWLGSDERWHNLAKRTVHDIISPEDLSEFLDEHEDRIEAIIHMGAISDTTERNTDKLMELNYGYTVDLFRWCTEHDRPFVYASSAATYGDGEHGFRDDDSRAYLESLRPLNAYAFSKNMHDKTIVSSLQQPSHWYGLKFFNVYGPNEYHKGRMESVVVQAFQQIKATGTMKLFKSHREEYGHGEQMRDFVYVKDIAQAVLWLIDNTPQSGVYNLGAGTARTFNDLVKAVCDAMGVDTKIQYVDTPVDVRGKYQYHTQADMTKFNAACNKAVSFQSLEEGVRDYVQTHLLRNDPYL